MFFVNKFNFLRGQQVGDTAAALGLGLREREGRPDGAESSVELFLARFTGPVRDR